MTEYHKIHSVFKRSTELPEKPLIIGQWTNPEFEYLRSLEWVWDEKVDGTNIRIHVTPDGVKYGGRTDNAAIPADLLNRLRERFDSAHKILAPDSPEGIVLYGEGYGPKIQKGGGLYRQDQDFVLFDVKVGRWWLSRDGAEDVADRLGLDVVPVVGTGTLYDAMDLCVRGFESKWGPFQAEGLVLRPKVPLFTRAGSRIITKMKCRDKYVTAPVAPQS